MTTVKYRKEQYEKHKLDRMKKIKMKDAEKMFKKEPDEIDGVYVFRGINKRTGRPVELRNPDKKELIRDWFTINDYLVEDE